jgi:hypothetical protein
MEMNVKDGEGRALFWFDVWCCRRVRRTLYTQYPFFLVCDFDH